MENVVGRRNILVSAVLMVIVARSITGVEPLLIIVGRVVKRDSVVAPEVDRLSYKVGMKGFWGAEVEMFMSSSS